ncbi:MAG TPA: hypothetical protein VGP87_00075 [Gemmatimonadales bacterium]|jgi:hypothetical protein|nr:hypothetical protein [Gemmatimonadales bacterium]
MHTIVVPSHSRTRRPSRHSKSDRRWSAPVWIILTILGLAAVVLLTATVLFRPKSVYLISIPAGVTLVGTLTQDLSSADAQPGQAVTLETSAPIRLSAELTLPPGLVVRGVVSEAGGGGRTAGAPTLAIRFTRIELQGQAYPIVTEPFQVGGKDAVEDVAKIEGGVTTRGRQIVIPAGSRLRVRLSQPVSIEYDGTPGGAQIES